MELDRVTYSGEHGRDRALVSRSSRDQLL